MCQIFSANKNDMFYILWTIDNESVEGFHTQDCEKTNNYDVETFKPELTQKL